MPDIIRKSSLLLLLLPFTAMALQDPTRPPAAFMPHQVASGPAAPATVVRQNDIRLRYILFSNERRIAMIGDQMLTEGQDIHGWKVVRIDRDRVTLSQGKRQRFLKIFPTGQRSSADDGVTKGDSTDAP